MLISEMKDSHLLNAHAMMMRRIKVWAAMDVELQRRKLKPKDVVLNLVPHQQYWDSYLENFTSIDEEVMF